jgi:hypothetical protein
VTQPEQIIEPLSPDRLNALEAGLARAKHLAGVSDLGDDDVQRLYDRLLAQRERDPADVIAVGLAMGEQMRKLGSFEWVRLVDEWGDETSLAVIGRKLACSPISMVQKRLDREESVDVAELQAGVAARLIELSKEAASRTGH